MSKKTEIEIDVDEIIQRLESEHPSASTWLGRMTAITDGVVDFDDIEPLLAMCATIADEALAAKEAAEGSVYVFCWHEVVSRQFEDFLRLQAKPKDPRFISICETFKRCGEVADWWLAQKAAAAT